MRPYNLTGGIPAVGLDVNVLDNIVYGVPIDRSCVLGEGRLLECVAYRGWVCGCEGGVGP